MSRDIPEPAEQQGAASEPGRDSNLPGPIAALGGRSAQHTTSGDDTRQRGWFWHWNGIITQYAPLIGLKGVGLLNSYTAWTDRREHSPHRGYAFPSQQAEAAFYGEDRAELITINKILVALDLIEIRKEMVEKADDQGRRWKVPHNFYRVKDRADGLTLTAADVLRVAELAEKDRAVYRYVRKVFSARFTPIDRNNVWHQILEEVRCDPTWQRLAEKTAKQEARASARTKAGHRSRAKGMPEQDDPARMTAGHLDVVSLDCAQQAETSAAEGPTSADTSNNGPAPDVAPANRGFEGDVDEPNSGLGQGRTTNAAPTNSAPPSVVEPGNTMYYQESTTTTTTTAPARDDGDDTGDGDDDIATPDQLGAAGSPDAAEQGVEVDSSGAGPLATDSSGASGLATQSGAESPGERAPERGAGDAGGWGPLGDPSPLVVSLFEAANDRKSTRLERILLSELERDAAPAAEASGFTGADWVAAALREAVGSGSSFVAPKRIREIVTRWAAEGAGPINASPLTYDAASAEVAQAPAITQAPVFWISTLETIKRALDESAFRRLLQSSDARRIAGDGVEVIAPSPQAAQKLDREYRPLIERHLARALGRPVTVTFVADGGDSESGAGELVTSLAADVGSPDAGDDARGAAARREVVTISPADEERGRQLWQAVLHDLGGALPAGQLGRLKGVTPLGQNEHGAIILGAPNKLALQLLTGRYRPLVESSLTTFLNQPVTIDVLAPDAWSVEL